MKIKKLVIDEREFWFRPGLNFVIGSNASGKTTIFKCIKHAFGLSVDLSFPLFLRLELVVMIGESEYRLVRESGSASVCIRSDEHDVSYRARSLMLDEFFQNIFEFKCAIGNKLASIFPTLDFCFLSDEERLNSKSLSSVLRLVCGANDKLIATATKDVQVLRSQIEIEESFLRRNDVFVDDFLRSLGAQPDDVQARINQSLEVARDGITRPLIQKQEIMQFSVDRIEELSRQNEAHFSEANLVIEKAFLALLQSFPDSWIESIKFESVITRGTNRFSYGQAIFADMLMLLSVARARCFIDLNFPSLYVNDSMGGRALDSSYFEKWRNLLEFQSREDEEFQYIEFTSNASVGREFVVAELDRKEWSL